MLEKGDIIVVPIEDVSDQGQGIGHVDGMAVFASYGLPGDVVKVEITKAKKRYVFGKTLEIETYSPDRIKAACPYTEICGGCQYQELTPKAQRQLKEKQIHDKLTRLAGLANPLIHPMVWEEENTGYRNKAVFHISTGGNQKKRGGIIVPLGNLAIGFMKKGSHQVFDCKKCMLQMPSATAAADAMRRFMTEDHITAYDPKWNQGLMKQMTVRSSKTTGQVMVILTIHGKGIPGVEKLIGLLDDAIYEAGFSLESVYIETEKAVTCIAGSRTIKDTLGDLTFEIGPRSFYQVDDSMTEKMYSKVKECAALTGKETVLDLYCGIGTIGLYCMDREGSRKPGAKFVLGIESNPQAILDANRNAVINGIVEVRYLAGKAEEILLQLLENQEDETLCQAAQSADVVILDPPRAGCKPELLEAVSKVTPNRIVYMSCDPGTQARDIKLLTTMGYQFVEITPFENFPWTGHVEACCLLVRTSESEVRT